MTTDKSGGATEARIALDDACVLIERLAGAVEGFAALLHGNTAALNAAESRRSRGDPTPRGPFAPTPDALLLAAAAFVTAHHGPPHRRTDTRDLSEGIGDVP